MSGRGGVGDDGVGGGGVSLSVSRRQRPHSVIWRPHNTILEKPVPLQSESGGGGEREGSGLGGQALKFAKPAKRMMRLEEILILKASSKLSEAAPLLSCPLRRP